MPTPEDASRLDAAVGDLAVGAQTWAALDEGQRATLLRTVRHSVADSAPEWADTAATSKGLEPGHPLRGEEWFTGPYATLGALDAYATTLDTLARGGSPLDGVRMRPAPGGRVSADTLPARPIDRVLLSGYTGEVWFAPGVTAHEARRDAGLPHRRSDETVGIGLVGGVGLVLGAGNVTSIPVLDVLYELIAHGRTAILKVNPTQDALVPVFERALAPLIRLDLLRIVTGSGEVGEYLTAHPGIAHVHITGAATTFDAIVWGSGDDRADKPLLDKPITAELGGVSPIIVVPGEWTAADLRFQAEHIVTMRLQNAGHNCIAGQVVILSSDWPQREEFLTALRAAYWAAPERPIWYPHGEGSVDAAAATHPDARRRGSRVLVEVDVGDDATALETTEYFAPVLGVVSLPGEGQAFLDAAVAHANDRLTGTLGANLLVDPATTRSLGVGLEQAIAELRYGTVALNAWTAVGFMTPTLTWGAFPGHTVAEVGSGLGIVHNALLLDHVERSVVRGPFRPFPRSLTGGGFTVLPKPPWFVTSRTGAAVSEGLTRYAMHRRITTLVTALVRAFGA